MKRIFLLALVFISLKSYGQYPLPQVIGSDSAIITSKGATKSRFININFTDTADANAQHIDEYPGAQIFTSSDNHFWLRSADTTAWMLFGSGGQDTVYVTDDLYVIWDKTGHQVIHRLHNDGLVSGGIVSWTGTGLTFAISSAIYYINQVRYESPQDTITLDPSDPSLARIDAFIVDTTASIGKITGTAAADPVTPQDEPAAQWTLATILLNAGDLIPSGVVVNKIYDENIEWTTSTTGTVTVDFDNTDNPFIGVKSAFVSDYNNNSKLLFTYGGTVTVGTGQTLKIHFYSNGAFTSGLRLRFFNTGNTASNSLTVTQGMGLNPANADSWQNLSIPLSAFTWSSTTFNRLVITIVGGGNAGFYLDDLQLQNGITNIPADIDYSNKLDSVTITKTTVGTDTSNVFKTYVKGLATTIGTVWTGGGGSVYTANNGLTMASNNVKLGGSLTAATTIAGGAFQLLVTGTDAGVVPFRVQNATAGGGTAIEGSALDGAGVSGSSTSGTGILAGSSTGRSIVASTTNGTQAAQFISNDASTNTVHPTAYIKRTTSGTAANGIGTSLEFYVEQSNGVHSGISNQIKSLWTDATTATRTSQLVFTGVNSTATGDLMKLDGNGDVTVTNLAGTGSRNVVADANGLLSAPVSDARLKRNIIPVSKYVDVLGLLKDEKKRGVFYNWKDPKRGTAKEIGFVAQGFEDIKGMTGTMNNTGYKYLNYDRITAILWEQNRALLERIEALEKTLNELLKR